MGMTSGDMQAQRACENAAMQDLADAMGLAERVGGRVTMKTAAAAKIRELTAEVERLMVRLKSIECGECGQMLDECPCFGDETDTPTGQKGT